MKYPNSNDTLLAATCAFSLILLKRVDRLGMMVERKHGGKIE